MLLCPYNFGTSYIVCILCVCASLFFCCVIMLRFYNFMFLRLIIMLQRIWLRTKGESDVHSSFCNSVQLNLNTYADQKAVPLSELQIPGHRCCSSDDGLRQWAVSDQIRGSINTEKEVHIHGQQIATLCGHKLVPVMWLWECSWDFSDCSKRDQNGTFGMHSKPSALLMFVQLHFNSDVQFWHIEAK